MSERQPIQDPQSVAEQAHQLARIAEFVDPTDPQSLEDHNRLQAHLEVMDQRNDTDQLINSDQYLQTQDNPYEEYSLEALARAWAHAEADNDQTIVEDVTDAIMERIDQHVAKAEEASSNREEALLDRANTDFHGQWLDRVVKLKDGFKEAEGGLEVKSDTKATSKEDAKPETPKKKAKSNRARKITSDSKNKTHKTQTDQGDEAELIEVPEWIGSDTKAAAKEEKSEPTPIITSEDVPEAKHEDLSDKSPEAVKQTPNGVENIRDACVVTKDELVRVAGNNGDELNEVYFRNNIESRKILMDALKDGSLYESPESFRSALEAAHVAAAADDVYDLVGRGSMPFTEADHGVMRDESSEFRMVVDRIFEARFAAEHVAPKYDDPYMDRFNTDGKIILELDGIAADDAPYDEISQGYYNFYYAPGSAISDYLEQAQKIGVNITEALNEETIDQERVVELIAKQYQYLATARPFVQINNSLFMNLVNGQLKAAGLEGVCHGSLDTVSHHIQPDNFAAYFADFVKEEQALHSSDHSKVESSATPTVTTSRELVTSMYDKDHQDDFSAYNLGFDDTAETQDNPERINDGGNETVTDVESEARMKWLGRKVGKLISKARQIRESLQAELTPTQVDDRERNSDSEVIPAAEASESKEAEFKEVVQVTAEDIQERLGEVYGNQNDAKYLSKVLAEDLERNDTAGQKIQEDEFEALLSTMRNDVAMVKNFNKEEKAQTLHPTTKAYMKLLAENKMKTLRKRYIRDTLMTRTRFMNSEQYHIFMNELDEQVSSSS